MPTRKPVPKTKMPKPKKVTPRRQTTRAPAGGGRKK